MGTPVLIDLGLLGSVSEPVPAPPPLRERWRRYRVPRPLVAAGLVLAMLAGGAAPPSGAGLTRLLKLTSDVNSGFVLDAGFLVVTGLDQIQVYQAATGRLRWQTRITPQPDTVPGDTGPGIAVDYNGPGVGCDIMASVRVLRCTSFRAFQLPTVGSTVAYDLDTGAPLWRRGENWYLSVPDADLLVGVAMTEAGDLTELTSIDPRTGATRWRVTESAADHVQLQLSGEEDLTRLPLTTAGGQVTVLDLTSGAPISSGHLDLLDDSAGDAHGPTVSLIGGQLLVLGGTFTSGYTLAGYDPDTLAPRWHQPLVNPDGYIFGCGPVLCWAGNGAFVALDPATGRKLWQRPGVYGQALRADRLLVFDNANVPAIVDPGTGRTLRGPDRWQLVDHGIDPATGLLLRGELHPSGTWVGRLDLTSLTVTPLAWLPGTYAQQCMLAGEVLACQSGVHELGLWRLGRR